jgi:hypothetical protein
LTGKMFHLTQSTILRVFPCRCILSPLVASNKFHNNTTH